MMCPKHGLPDEPFCSMCEMEYHLMRQCNCSTSDCTALHCVGVVCPRCCSPLARLWELYVPLENN